MKNLALTHNYRLCNKYLERLYIETTQALNAIDKTLGDSNFAAMMTDAEIQAELGVGDYLSEGNKDYTPIYNAVNFVKQVHDELLPGLIAKKYSLNEFNNHAVKDSLNNIRLHYQAATGQVVSKLEKAILFIDKQT